MEAAPSLLTSWSFKPLQIVPTLIVALLYARRVQSLRERGTPVPRWRVVCFSGGLVLVFLALASPIDAFGEEEFLFMHMTQHLLLGDLAPLLFLLGLTGPILRPVLALPGVGRLQVLGHPLVALPIWAANLYLWHLPGAYQAALHHDSVHAVQHMLFLACGGLMWAPIFEVLPAPAWFGTGAKLGYTLVVRLIESILGNVFIWAGGVFYPIYRHTRDLWGISAHADQGIAGGVMMIEGSLVTMGVLVWLFLRMAQESELRQSLLEQGHDPRAVVRAVRYRRAGTIGSGD